MTNYKGALVTGVILGITAALVVWFLERFESQRNYEMMKQHYEQWWKERGEA